MRYKFNCKTFGFERVEKPESVIAKAVNPNARVDNDTKWDSVRYVRQGAAVCMLGGRSYLCVRLNGQWRSCGIITDSNCIMRAMSGALVDFHQAWLMGTPIAKPSIN